MTQKKVPSRVHVVVTCSNRKRQPVPPVLNLGTIRDRRLGPRFSTWIRRLTSGDASPYVAAIDLYAGEHWQIARSLPSLISDRPTVLWTCSAGYGLIPATARIRPYAATFSPGRRDSVGDDRAAARDWWQRQTEWEGPAPGEPRSFTELARQDPDAIIVAVLSEAYQSACSSDIAAAAEKLNDEQQLTVLGPNSTALSRLVVAVDASLQPAFGGSLLAINVRAAAHLLKSANGDLSRTALAKSMKEARTSAPTRPPRPAGQRLTDEEVRTFIRSHTHDQAGTATALLRKLRSSGRSCEQARFGQLFAQVTAAPGGR